MALWGPATVGRQRAQQVGYGLLAGDHQEVRHDTETLELLCTFGFPNYPTLLQINMEVERGPEQDYYPLYRALYELPCEFSGGYSILPPTGLP